MLRTLTLFFALCGCGAGCGGSSPGPSQDLAAVDIPKALGDMTTSSTDMAGLPFGAACTADKQCATGNCFIGGMMSFCTMPCTAATQATDCPAPPTSGTCNMRGFCKP